MAIRRPKGTKPHLIQYFENAKRKVNVVTADPAGLIIESTNTAIEIAGRAYGTLRRVYKTSADRNQFFGILGAACRRAGLDEPAASAVTDATERAFTETQRLAKRRFKRAFWRLRIDRGPGIDRLTTVELYQWLDRIYRLAVAQEGLEGAPPTISDHFNSVLGDSFRPEQPDARADYARRLLKALGRNDDEYRSYAGTTTLIFGGAGVTGLGGALAYGVHGAADADVKTALAVIAGTTLTALFATFIREIERRLATLQGDEQPTVPPSDPPAIEQA